MRISSAPLKQPRRNDGGELPGQRAAKCYLESWGFWSKIEQIIYHTFVIVPLAIATDDTLGEREHTHIVRVRKG